MRARFKNLALIPGVRWVPHDLPHQEQKHKSRPHLFSLKSSSSSDALRPRKSTLSLTSEPDEELDARTHTQAQSRFFALLPLELRRMIYEYVVGAETIHLTFSAKKKFGHFVCEWADDLEGRECPCRVLVGGRACRRLNVGCAHMMRTCRRMYSEAIPYVYRAHTFSLLHLTHLLYLPTSLPQQRLNTIRVLRLRWAIRAMPYLRRGNKLAYREDTANWEKGWKILADMQGLRDLYVVLVDVSPQSIWERNWLQLEPKLLEPVKNITKPHWFELVLPFAGCKTDWDMGESRVILRTPTSAFAEEQN